MTNQNAVLYHRLFVFVDPVHEGHYLAPRRDLHALSLAGQAGRSSA